MEEDEGESCQYFSRFSILEFCSWKWSQKIFELLLFPDGPSGLPTSQNEEFRPFIRWNSTPKTKTHCSSMFCPGACQSSNSGTRRPRPRWLLSYIIALLCLTYFRLVILSLFALAPLSFISMVKFNKNIQVIAFCCTFFQVFNIPVFWPILVMYFITLFCITMKRQIKVNIILNVVSIKMKW